MRGSGTHHRLRQRVLRLERELDPRGPQGSAIPPKSLSIRYYTYYIILRINTVGIMGPLLLVLTYFSNIVLQRSRCLVVEKLSDKT